MELIKGDCLEVMQTIPDKSVDLILCDLPYGTTGCPWDIIIPFDKLWMMYNKVLKPNATVLLFGSEPFASMVRLSNLEMYRYDWVWEKNNCGNFQLVNHQPMKVHETISVFYDIPKHYAFSDIIVENMKRLNLSYNDVTKLFLSKNGKTTGWLWNKINGSQLPTREQWSKLCELFGIQDEYDKLCVRDIPKYNLDLIDVNLTRSNVGKAGNLGHLGSENKRETYIQTKSGYPKSILKFNRETGLHPTQKPVALLEFLIKTHSNPGDVVLDNCMGSGSTGIACINTDRNFIGIEMDDKYFDVARQRIENHQKNI